MDKDKQTSSAYDIKRKEKTSITSKKKEKAQDDYFLSMNAVNSSAIQHFYVHGQHINRP